MKRSIMILAAIVLLMAAPLYAQYPVHGAITANAGSAVTKGRFVKLDSAGVISHATAETDSVVGVCEQTQATTSALTKYSPVGLMTTVTSGESVAVGDLLTGGTLGKAFVLDADDAATQRYAAIALSACTGADKDVTVIVLPGVSEQRLALASLTVGGGFGSTGVTVSAAGVVQADGAITSTGAVTGGTLTDGAFSCTAGAITGTCDISGATVTYRSILNADINAAAAIVRSKLAEEALAEYGVPFSAFRNDNGTVLTNSAGAGVFGVTAGGYGVGTLVIAGETASNNSKTDTLQFEFVLPPEYVAAGDCQLVVTAKETVGAATTATTLSVQAYESDGEGAVGANLAGAPSVTDITMTWQTSTTAITAAGLAAGDRLIIFVRIVTNDTGAAVGTVANIGKISLKLDIKG